MHGTRKETPVEAQGEGRMALIEPRPEEYEDFLQARIWQIEQSLKGLKRLLEEQEFGQITGEPGHEITIVRNVPKDWFQTAQGLGKEVSRLAHLFPRLGFKYHKEKGSKGARKIYLKKCETYATHATPTSRSPETVENDGLKGGICSENAENHMPHMPPVNKGKVAGGIRVASENETYATRETLENEKKNASHDRVASEALNSEKIPMEDLEEIPMEDLEE
jgi:hypothetical protein